MQYEFITERDFDSTPQQYERYLRETYENAKRILSLPEQQWPRGSSHAISRGIMSECEGAIYDLRLEFGTFDPFTFKFAGYPSA